MLPNNTSPLIQSEEISIGEWCLFVQKKKYWIGLVLSFCYVSGKTFREREYTKSYALVKSQQNMNAGQSQDLSTSIKLRKPVAVLCSWYSWDSHGLLNSADEKIHEFIPVENYRGTMLKPLYINNFLQISDTALETLNELNREKNGR